MFPTDTSVSSEMIPARLRILSRRPAQDGPGLARTFTVPRAAGRGASCGGERIR